MASSSASRCLNDNSLKLRDRMDCDALAWDLDSISEPGAKHQPWRVHWPLQRENLSEDDLKSQPWIGWKRDPKKINDKPWYYWVQEFDLEIEALCCAHSQKICSTCHGEGCGLCDRDPDCEFCHGKGCGVCSTVAEGG